MMSSGIMTDPVKFVDRISILMNNVLDNSLEKVGLNQFVQSEAFRAEVEPEEIVLDGDGKPKMNEKK